MRRLVRQQTEATRQAILRGNEYDPLSWSDGRVRDSQARHGHDRRRSKVADILLGSGERVQFSVLECHLTGEELERLRAKLTRVIAPAEDSVRFYALCERRRQSVVVEGKAAATEGHDFYVV